MDPEDNHRIIVLLRALILSALAALGWLILGAATAQADTGLNDGLLALVSSPAIGTVQPAPAPALHGVAIVDPQRNSAHTPITRALPTLPVSTTPALQAASVTSVSAAVGGAEAVLPAQASVDLEKVPVISPIQLLSVLTVRDPIVGPTLPVPGAINGLLPYPALSPLPSTQPETSAEPAAKATAPSAPALQAANIVLPPHSQAGGLNSLAVQASGRVPVPMILSAAPGHAAGQPLYPPLAPPLESSALSAAPGTGAAPSPQEFAESADCGIVPPPSGMGQICEEYGRLPQGPAFDPGSSPD